MVASLAVASALCCALLHLILPIRPRSGFCCGKIILLIAVSVVHTRLEVSHTSTADYHHAASVSASGLFGAWRA